MNRMFKLGLGLGAAAVLAVGCTSPDSTTNSTSSSDNATSSVSASNTAKSVDLDSDIANRAAEGDLATYGGARLRAVVVRSKGEGDLIKRASLLRRDSVHGAFDGTITTDEENNTIWANGTPIRIRLIPTCLSCGGSAPVCTACARTI